MRHDVVVVGSINVDLLLRVDRHPRPGETLLGGSAEHLAGGKGANQAVAAARSGARTAMVGAVGTDATAETALEHLRGADVDLTAVQTVPGPTGLAVVTVADDGENTIVVIAGANATVTPEVVRRAAPVIEGAKVCVLQAEVPLPSVEEAVRLAHAAGVRVVLNVAPAVRLPLQTLRAADPLVVNQHEASILLEGLGAAPAGLGGEAEAGAAGIEDADGDGPEVAAGSAAGRALRDVGVPSVIVTLGGAGSVVLDDSGARVIPAHSVPVVDTTGAGDAFVGALAAGLAAGQTLAAAATHATRVAAASVQRLGAQASYPWKDDPLP